MVLSYSLSDRREMSSCNISLRQTHTMHLWNCSTLHCSEKHKKKAKITDILPITLKLSSILLTIFFWFLTNTTVSITFREGGPVNLDSARTTAILLQKGSLGNFPFLKGNASGKLPFSNRGISQENSSVQWLNNN